MNKNLIWLTKGGKVEAYLTNKGNLVKLVIFTAVFSLIFINSYKPFDSSSWYQETSSFGYFLASFFIVLTGVLVVAFSRFLMYRFVRKHTLYYAEYLLWLLCEIIILSGFYTLYAIVLRDDLSFWSMESIITIFKEANINTILIIAIPYAFSWLYFSYSDKKERLKYFENGQFAREQAILQFKDEKGEMRFSVSASNIVFIEAADNYVEINYLNQGKLAKHLLRNSLKRVAEELNETSIQRCHRSYMVNFIHITSIRKNGDEVDLEMDIPDVKKIPVSKSYSDCTTEAFLLYSGASQN